MSGRQQRFQKDTNHKISKRLVTEAKDTNRSIKVENLTNIGARTTVQGSDNRAKHKNWAFAQLQYFLAYKARMHGVKLEQVNPRYTSQRCFECGHIEKANRKTQDTFLCCRCGHTNHADINAARNIAFWAVVNPPIVANGHGSRAG
jgi:putative transposase